MKLAHARRVGTIGTMPKKGRPAAEGMPVTLRLPSRLIEALDAEAQHLAAETPHVSMSRATAIRALLFEAISNRRKARGEKPL
jgi:hypothetical protein